jgi:signal peptidase I
MALSPRSRFDLAAPIFLRVSDPIHEQGGSLPSDPFIPALGDEVPGRKKRDPLPFWVELPLLVLVALVIAVLIKTFLVQAFWIPSSSMENTLLVNDRVLVNKLAYRVGDVGRGQVIVFDDPRGGEERDEGFLEAAARNVAEAIGLSTPRSEFIKRVIALPGETIEIRDGRLLIDGIAIDEPYLKPGEPMPDFAPVLVPADHVFVMGDNRAASQDSRFFGPIPTGDVVGRAFVIIWPPSRWGGL